LILKFLTSSLFSEVNSYFSISHKVSLKIREILNENIDIFHDLQLNAKEKDMEIINLIVSTNKAALDVAVKGPDISRKDKMIQWGLWLPYEAIVSSTDQVIPYLKYYCEALVLLLGKYGISEERIRELWTNVESEIVGNSEYKYEEDDIEYDFSDVDLS
jgi:hypothetical protein